MNEDKNSVPTWEKYALTIPEAKNYFGIGEDKLREIIKSHPYSDFVLQNGIKSLIKREKFLNETLSI